LGEVQAPEQSSFEGGKQRGAIGDIESVERGRVAPEIADVHAQIRDRRRRYAHERVRTPGPEADPGECGAVVRADDERAGHRPDGERFARAGGSRGPAENDVDAAVGKDVMRSLVGTRTATRPETLHELAKCCRRWELDIVAGQRGRGHAITLSSAAPHRKSPALPRWCRRWDVPLLTNQRLSLLADAEWGFAAIVPTGHAPQLALVRPHRRSSAHRAEIPCPPIGIVSRALCIASASRRPLL